MNLLRRGGVVKLDNKLVVVLLDRHNYGWDCLCIACPPTESSSYFGQDILVFMEDLKDAEPIGFDCS